MGSAAPHSPGGRETYHFCWTLAIMKDGSDVTTSKASPTETDSIPYSSIH